MYVFIEDAIKTFKNKEYVYPVKKLTLDLEDNEISIEPYSNYSATRIMSLFKVSLRTAQWEPKEYNLPEFTFEKINDKTIIVKGNKIALERAINALNDNSFITPETSSKIINKLHSLEAPAVNPANERTSLLKPH